MMGEHVGDQRAARTRAENNNILHRSLLRISRYSRNPGFRVTQKTPYEAIHSQRNRATVKATNRDDRSVHTFFHSTH